MKKILATIVALAGAMALSFVLVGCGGGGAQQTIAGDWTLYEITGDEASAASPEDVQSLADMGMTVTMTLNEDGTGTMNMFGEQMDLTWETTDSGFSIAIQGDAAPATLTDNGNLSVDAGDGSALVFAPAAASAQAAA